MMICSIDGCGKPARTRGWCNTHHMRWYRHGDPLRVSDQRGESNHRWSGRTITYFGAHNRTNACEDQRPTTNAAVAPPPANGPTTTLTPMN